MTQGSLKEPVATVSFLVFLCITLVSAVYLVGPIALGAIVVGFILFAIFCACLALIAVMGTAVQQPPQHQEEVTPRFVRGRYLLKHPRRMKSRPDLIFEATFEEKYIRNN